MAGFRLDLLVPMARLGRRVALVAGLSLVAAVLVACGGEGGGPADDGEKVDGGTATVALPPGEQPNYIFPFLDWAHSGLVNPGLLHKQMFRPLYWSSDGDQPVVNRELSLGEPSTISEDGRTVSVKLKDYEWSDGTKVTARNVAFWMGLVQYAGDSWVGSSTGYWPDNLQSAIYDDEANEITFKLKRPVSQIWFEQNVLANTTPLPLAWDLEGEGKPGECSSADPAKQKASCPKVFEYLNEQSNDLATYDTNPLWQIVDGPWRLKEFNADGHVTLVPNEKYSGAQKPALDELKYLPFTSEAAEFNTLRANDDITYGYVPTSFAPKAGEDFEPSSNPLGDRYVIEPRYTWGFNYLVLNMQNPEHGALFRQLYFRQALQHSVDQPTVIDVAMKGYGVVTSGPIPIKPDNPFVGEAGTTELYPFSVADAKQLLLDNGWDVPAEGPASCTSPGTEAGQCGPGIKAGDLAEFDLEFMSGSASVKTMMEQFASSAGEAGIKINLSEAPYNTVISKCVVCAESDPACSWQASHWGAGWTFLTSFYPTGEKFFVGGSGSNYSNYADPAMDELVTATVSTDDTGALGAYEEYAAEQLPVTYLPTEVDLVAIDARLRGATPISPLQVITPEFWYFTE